MSYRGNKFYFVIFPRKQQTTYVKFLQSHTENEQVVGGGDLII